MKRKTMFMVQGIVSLVAVIAIGVMSVLSPISVVVYPTTEDFYYLGEVAAECEDSEELSKWVTELAISSKQPAKELTEDDKEYLARILQAEAAEVTEKAELEAKIIAYEVAVELEKSLRNDTRKQKEHAEILETISEMEKELDKTFEEKKVAESVVLKRQVAVHGQLTKGVEMSVSILAVLTNIKGFINLDKLITANKRFDELTIKEELDDEQTKEKSELVAFLSDRQNYEGINAKVMNISMFVSGLYNKALEQEEDLYSFNKYRVMYQTVYDENVVLDTDGLSGISTLPGLFGLLSYIVFVLCMVINAIIALIKALTCIKKPNKLYEGAIKRFMPTAVFAIIGLLVATCMGSAYLNVIGIIMLVIVFCVFLLNGFAVRMEKRNKEENIWLNFTQGAALLCSVLALIAALLLVSGNPFDTYNASFLTQLQKGQNIIKAEKLASYCLGVFGLCGILACSYLTAVSLQRMACLSGRKKSEADIFAKLNIFAYIFEGVLIMGIPVLMIMGISLGNTAIVVLIFQVVMMAIQIVSKVLCKKFATNLSETRITELQSAAYFTENELDNHNLQQPIAEGIQNQRS